MSVENQIAVHADEPEQISAHEYFKMLGKSGYAYIAGEYYSYDDIFEMIDEDAANENNKIKLMTDKIQEIIG
jgi:hypothetical protein